MLPLLALLLTSPAQATPNRKALDARLSQVETALVEQEAVINLQSEQVAALSAQLAQARAEGQATRDALDEAEAAQALLQTRVEAMLTQLQQPPPKGSKADPRIPAIQAELAALKAELQAQAVSAKPAPSPTLSQIQEDMAAGLLREANDAIKQADFATAKAKLEELQRSYPGARTSRSATSLLAQVAVVGIHVSPEPAVERWYTRPTTLDAKPVTVVVFWESWCPHCRREVPKLQELSVRYADRGVQVVGLTRVTKSSTEETVQAFIRENGLTFPIAKEDGAWATLFAVTGIPAAAVLVGDRVVWRGHPANLTDEMLAQWVK